MKKKIKLTQQTEKHAVIVALKAEHHNLEITRFVKDARSLIVRKWLEAIVRNFSAVVKLKISTKIPNTITSRFVLKV